MRGKMKNKFMLVGIVTVLSIMFLAFSPLIVSAQYQTQQSVVMTVPDSGVVVVDQNATVGGLSIAICASCGVTITVATVVYNANPQADAVVPANVALTHFVALTFADIAPNDFGNATVTIHYTDADLAGMSQPYILYKYDAATNSYLPLDTVLDTSAKTLTTTLTSINDPLFAIGGAVASSVAPTGGPAPISGGTWVWIGVGIVCVIAVLGLLIRKNRSDVARSNKSA
jgi:uncharacterized protein Usg